MTVLRVLFVGLGVMGRPMARNLAASGRAEVLVHDADAGRVADAGLTAGDPAAEAERLDVLVLMLPGSHVVEHVLDDVLDRLRPGATVLDMSSSRPSSTVALAQRAAERGIAYVDAPVSGGRAKAEPGELSIMVGGAPEAVEAVRPLLETMGTTILPAGPAGSGHAAKALNNLLSAMNIAAAAEVLAVAARFGLDPATMLDVVNASTGRSQATEVKFGPQVLSGAFDAGFALDLMVKDLQTAQGLAREAGAVTPLADAVVDAASRTRAESADGADHTVLARWIAARTGATLHEGDAHD